MEKKHCVSNIETIRRFLNATEGNWRNTLYIECSVCKYGGECRDHLFVPDEDGTPLLLPVSDVELLIGRLVDKSECLGLVSNARFAALFHKWMQRLASDPAACPFLQADKLLNAPEDW